MNGNHYSWEDMDFTAEIEEYEENNNTDDDGEQVTVFDAQFTPELAAQLLAEIQAETDSPVGAVVVTSPNPDKFNGASVFQAEGAELVASEATAAAMPGVHAVTPPAGEPSQPVLPRWKLNTGRGSCGSAGSTEVSMRANL